jgi:hypothetical protein
LFPFISDNCNRIDELVSSKIFAMGNNVHQVYVEARFDALLYCSSQLTQEMLSQNVVVDLARFESVFVDLDSSSVRHIVSSARWAPSNVSTKEVRKKLPNFEEKDDWSFWSGTFLVYSDFFVQGIYPAYPSEFLADLVFEWDDLRSENIDVEVIGCRIHDRTQTIY